MGDAVIIDNLVRFLGDNFERSASPRSERFNRTEYGCEDRISNAQSNPGHHCALQVKKKANVSLTHRLNTVE